MRFGLGGRQVPGMRGLATCFAVAHILVLLLASNAEAQDQILPSPYVIDDLSDPFSVVNALPTTTQSVSEVLREAKSVDVSDAKQMPAWTESLPESNWWDQYVAHSMLESESTLETSLDHLILLAVDNSAQLAV
ncbi:MAG: hypothetical protein AAFP90_10040, partial [Planctomycetota bacterium]